MITYTRKAGSTSQTMFVRIVDSTTGAPVTTATYNTNSPAFWYRQDGAAKQTITLATQTDAGAWASGGFVHIADGYYRLDVPNLALTGSTGVLVGGTMTGMIVIGFYVHLTSFDPWDGVKLGITGIPNAAAGASGGLPTLDSNLVVASNITRVKGATRPADVLDISLRCGVVGTVITGANSQSQMVVTPGSLLPAGQVNNQFSGKTGQFPDNTTKPALRGQPFVVQSYDNTTGVITFQGNLTTAPDVGDTFVLF